MVATILSADPLPPHLNLGPKGQNSTFSEHGHVAYQIKWNRARSIAMLQHVLKKCNIFFSF